MIEKKLFSIVCESVGLIYALFRQQCWYSHIVSTSHLIALPHFLVSVPHSRRRAKQQQVQHLLNLGFAQPSFKHTAFSWATRWRHCSHTTLESPPAETWMAWMLILDWALWNCLINKSDAFQNTQMSLARTGYFSEILRLSQSKYSILKQSRVFITKDRLTLIRNVPVALQFITEPNPALKTVKRYTSREIMGVMQPYIWIRFLGTCDIRYFRNKLCLTCRRLSLTTFTTKSYLRSETYIIYKFYTLYPKKVFFEGNFCLCVVNIMYV